MKETILLDIIELSCETMVVWIGKDAEEVIEHLPSIHDSIVINVTEVEVTLFISVNMESVIDLGLLVEEKDLTDRMQTSSLHELTGTTVLTVYSEDNVIDSFLLLVTDIVHIPFKHELLLIFKGLDNSKEETCISELLPVHISLEHPEMRVVEVIEGVGVVKVLVILHSPYGHDSIKIIVVCCSSMVMVEDLNLISGTSTMDAIFLVEVTVMVEGYVFCVDNTKLVVREEETLH